jgi:ATP-dependent helicase YprA (DUF1998 family)
METNLTAKTFVTSFDMIMPSGTPPPLTLNKICDCCQKVLGYQPCQWQLDVCQALLSGKNLIMSTGAGKTLMFWLPAIIEETV